MTDSGTGRRIAVAGGTGVVGRHVVAAPATIGAEPVVLARSAGVDLVTERGLETAMRGVAAVIDVSNLSTQRRQASISFFTTTTGRLLETGERAGVRHHVALSIVGVDRVDSGYYAGKRAQEQLVLSGPVPASVLRATQFHEFAEQILALTRGPVAPVPVMRIQPVAAREVTTAPVALAMQAAVGLALSQSARSRAVRRRYARTTLQDRSRHSPTVPDSLAPLQVRACFHGWGAGDLTRGRGSRTPRRGTARPRRSAPRPSHPGS